MITADAVLCQELHIRHASNNLTEHCLPRNCHDLSNSANVADDLDDTNLAYGINGADSADGADGIDCYSRLQR